MGLRLNLGCGPLRKEGEIGVDLNQTEGCDVISDIRTLPFDTGSAEFVRLDHVLEHQPQRDAVEVLLEARRVLEPGGQIRVGVPDFMSMCKEYAGESQIAEKALLLRNFYGSQIHAGEFHQSGWDEQTLGDLLKAVGFHDIEIGNDPDRDEGVCLKAVAYA